jgi:hypothetical protein
MKWSALSARERRTVTLGAVITIVSLSALYVVRPYRAALADAQDQLAAERATLARERAAVAESRRNPELRRVADSAMQNTRSRLFGKGRRDGGRRAGVIHRRRRAETCLPAGREHPPRPRRCRAAYGRCASKFAPSRTSSGRCSFCRRSSAVKLVQVDQLDITRSSSGDTDMEVLSIAATIGICGAGVGDRIHR